MEFSQLEKDILDHLARSSIDPALIKQLKNAQPKDREVSDEGVFVELSLPPEFKSPDNKSHSKNPIQGPKIQCQDSTFVGNSLIFISEGQISVLEIFSDKESFPKKLGDYKLF